MQLETENEEKFLKKLNNIALLNKIGANEIVALKITRKDNVDGGKGLDVYIVVDTLDEIYQNAQLVVGFATFLEHEMSYKKTFSIPENSTKSSFISFNYDLRSVGIGSEFVRNEIALFQQCGMAKTAVNAVSKEIKVYGMLERELNAEVVMDSLWDKILPDANLTREFAALLFRIGVLNSYQLDEIWDLAAKEEDVISELKSIFNQAIEDECQEGESVLHMFNRRTMQFVRERARLEQLIDIYEDLLSEPLVTANFPEIKDEYEAFKNYKDLAIETPVYNLEPLTLGMEQRLIDTIPEFEENLLSYINNDILGYAVVPNSLFTGVVDITETYNEFSSYVGRVLPFIDLKGTIPDQVRPDNMVSHVSLMLKTAANLSEQRNPREISEILQSENIWSSLALNTNKIQKEAIVSQAVQSLFYALLQKKTLSISTIKKYFRFFYKKGLFDGELLLHSGQWAVNVIQANPNGAKVVFLSLASLFIDNPREASELFKRLMAVEGVDFAALVRYASSVDSNTFITQLPDLLTVFEAGIRERLDILCGTGGEKFGRLNLLMSNNSVITPDVLDPSKLVMQIENRQSDENGFFAEGFSSSELAGNLFQELTEKGIGVTLMKGVSKISGEDQFFLKIGSVNIGISPFAQFINPDYNDVAPVDPDVLKKIYESNRFFVPLTANEPLIWRNLNRLREMYFTGRIETVRVEEIDYIDVIIESKIRTGDGTLSAQTSTLRVPKANLFDLYDAVMSADSAKTFQSILRFKHADLSFTSTTDKPEIAKFRANYFNDIFYQLISHMDPLWMYTEKVNNAVAGFNQLDPVSLADKMDITRYADISNIARQIVLKQQLIESEQQQDMAIWDPDRIDISNTLNPDFSVIAIDSFPVGYMLGSEISLLEPLQYAVPVVKEKIAKDSNYSFSPFVKTNSQNSTFTNIAVFKPTEYGSLSAEPELGLNMADFDPDYYKQEISRALINVGFNIKDMFAENISIQLVQGHWRLGNRQANISDGSTTLNIDIDALRDPLLLELILRHELLPHFGAAGEVHALLNDIFHFNSLSHERQQRLLSVLRNENVDLRKFADILDKSIGTPLLGIISDVAAYVSDDKKYPQLSLELKGMSGDELYRYLSHSFNDKLASELEEMNLTPLDVLKLTVYPKSYDLSAVFTAIKQLEQDPAFPESARLTAVSFLLDNKLETDALAESFYNMDMDANRELFENLFLFFGPEIVPVLLRGAQTDIQRLTQFESFMITFAKAFGDTFEYSIEFEASEEFLKIVFERGDTNVERFYTVSGKIYSENVYDHVDWYSAIPEQTEQIANLCEDIFGKNLEDILVVLGDLIEEPKNYEKVKSKIVKYNDKLHNLVEQMMGDYHKVKTARKYLDLRNIPVSKKEMAVNINTQFASDLIGSPISYGLGMIQMAEIEINQAADENREIDFDEVINFMNLAFESFTNLRQLIVRYRIIRDYRIALNDDNYMVKFEESMALDANTQVRDPAFYPESAVAEQIKLRMNTENDVYVVYFSGYEINSIRFISNLIDKIGSGKLSKIVVVSPQLDTDAAESLLSEFNITQASALILGKDILAKSDAVSGSDIISVIEQNVQTEPDNIIFLSDKARVFSGLMKEGLTVLPLPDIKQTPKAYSPALGSKAVIDRAA